MSESLIPMTNEYLATFGIRKGARQRAFEHVGHNIWVDADSPIDIEHRVRMLMLVVPAGSAISHDSAAWWYGLPVDAPQDRFHITVPPGKNLARRNFRVHVASLLWTDMVAIRGLQLTTPERTYLDLAGRMDRERLIAIGDAILAAGLATRESLLERVQIAYRARGVRVAREIVGLVDGRAQSPPESILRLRFHDARLPAPVPQCPIDLGGFTAHVDLGWQAARVGVEYEGRQHAEQEQFGRDIDRYSALAARGWLILRAGRRDLRDQSRQLIQRVSAALRRRGPSPTLAPPAEMR